MTIRPNCICTKQNLSEKMRYIKFTWVLRYKRITESRQEDEILMIVNKKEKKKKTCRLDELAVPVDSRVRLKESDKIITHILEPYKRTKKQRERKNLKRHLLRRLIITTTIYYSKDATIFCKELSIYRVKKKR